MSEETKWCITDKCVERGKAFGMTKKDISDMIDDTRVGAHSILNILEHSIKKGYVLPNDQMDDGTCFYGIFDASGDETFLSECTGIEVETIENLKGARVEILGDATGDDEYFDVMFLNQYDQEEQPIVINALSKRNFTFEEERV